MDVGGGSSCWLDGKKILLTGATGYLGKVICEKLLRECIGIRRIYVLIRSKKIEDFNQRACKFKDDVVFHRAKSIDRRIMEKVVPIEGDLSKPNLDLREYDGDLLRRDVNVVIHAGCKSDLYISLTDAILTNVRGTKFILQLAESIVSLESFIYVSHIFSNCYERIIGERIFPPRYDPVEIIRIVEQKKEFFGGDEIIKNFASFYLFSHHLSEYLVARSEIPSAVIRLPTLTPSLDEPYPGWIPTSNHLDNLLMFMGSGSVQAMYGKVDTPIDILPVDLAAKGIISITQKRSLLLQPSSCEVYNLTDCGLGEISWEALVKSHRKMNVENPLETIYSYPGAHIYTNFYIYIIAVVLLQLIPAVVFDFFGVLYSGKVHFVRAQLETLHQLQSVERFFQRVWMFDTENVDELFESLSFTEKLKFKFRTQKFNLDEYVRNWNYGRRVHFLQLPQYATRFARFKVQACYILGVLLKTVLLVYFGHVFLRLIGCDRLFGANSSLDQSEYDQIRSHLFSTFQKI